MFELVGPLGLRQSRKFVKPIPLLIQQLGELFLVLSRLFSNVVFECLNDWKALAWNISSGPTNS
jgi:hypothetical protein